MPAVTPLSEFSVTSAICKIKRLLGKRYPGIISSDIALSPLAMMGMAVALTLLLMAIKVGLSYLFFSEVTMKGARYGSIHPDIPQVQASIYNGVTKVLPATKEGVTLFQSSDIEINPADGDFVTVKAKYTVMLPGLDLYQGLGGNGNTWIVPIRAQFSFYREY
ncbi:hypothetical protein ACFSR7_05745 [Cohnella sp. GCM10020058]|uniref:hypothetical protein n=1 Tax=Cohnella sp. GCM10020058 TaxID=3317330 RepID=UPI003632261D